MTIQELADMAGVTTRTIRYYVDEGVLPPPGRGRPSEYTEEHLRRLELIRRLKDQYLPLEEIRDTLLRLSLDEVEALLQEAPQGRISPGQAQSAADYVAAVLGQGAAREEKKRQGMPPPAPMPSPAYAPAPPAGRSGYEGYAPHKSARKREQSEGEVAETSAALPEPPAAESLPTAQGEEIERLNLATNSGTWNRINLAPGFELHYAVTDDAQIDEAATRIIEAATQILEELPEKE